MAKTKKPVAKAKKPVAKAKKPVAKAKKPAAKAKQPVAKAKPPVEKAKKPVAKAKQPAAKAKQPVAKAKQPVAKPAQGEVVVIENDAQLTALFETARQPLLLDLGAKWCRPCQEMAPEIVQVARRLAGHVTAVTVDVEACPEARTGFHVDMIPLLVLIDGARRKEHKTAGFKPADEIEAWVREALGRA